MGKQVVHVEGPFYLCLPAVIWPMGLWYVSVPICTGAVLDYSETVILKQLFRKRKLSIYISVNEFMMFIWNVYMIMASDICSDMKYVHVYYLLCVRFPHWALSSPHHSVVLAVTHRSFSDGSADTKIPSPSLPCVTNGWSFRPEV